MPQIPGQQYFPPENSNWQSASVSHLGSTAGQIREGRGGGGQLKIK